MAFSAAAVELIKEFEGYRSWAYRCPAMVWTIGYGHTDNVHQGMTCTEEQAHKWLVEDMGWADEAVSRLITARLTQSEHDALVSFTFNCGAGALESSTLLKRLNAGQPAQQVIKEELIKWVKAGGETLPGLVRRRQAEIALAVSGEEVAPEPEEEPIQEESLISLTDAAFYYQEEAHQVEAFEYLEDLLTLEELDEFARIYRNGPQSAERVLRVRHMIQLDNGPHGYRQCFTTTCAMLLEYLRPGTLSTQNGDLDYLKTVERYGDTTDANAQIQALRSYGINARFVTNASWETIENQIAKGKPVPCGWLHKGAVGSPSGGGHWSLVIGIDGDKAVHNDPYGEANLVGGGYVRQWLTDGQAVRYSRKNWAPRWEVEGPGTGWAVIVD